VPLGTLTARIQRITSALKTKYSAKWAISSVTPPKTLVAESAAELSLIVDADI
jgi:hypothetical protein